MSTVNIFIFPIWESPKYTITLVAYDDCSCLCFCFEVSACIVYFNHEFKFERNKKYIQKVSNGRKYCIEQGIFYEVEETRK